MHKADDIWGSITQHHYIIRRLKPEIKTFFLRKSIQIPSKRSRKQRQKREIHNFVLINFRRFICVLVSCDELCDKDCQVTFSNRYKLTTQPWWNRSARQRQIRSNIARRRWSLFHFAHHHPSKSIKFHVYARRTKNFTQAHSEKNMIIRVSWRQQH